MSEGDDAKVEIMWEGRFITAKRDGKWEYVSRSRGIKAAVILAIDEDSATAAIRELEEETGYRAGTMKDCGEFYSSPGMVSESFSLFKASGLSKVSEGGGIDGENITVHRVALGELDEFVAQKRREGTGIDVKLLLLLQLP